MPGAQCRTRQASSGGPWRLRKRRSWHPGRKYNGPEVFEFVLFIFGDEALMKTAIEQAFHCSIDVALQRTVKQLVEFTALRAGEPIAERIESAAVFLRREDFPADDRRHHHREERMSASRFAWPDRFRQVPSDFRQASCRTPQRRSPRHSRALPCEPRDFRCRDCAKAGHNPRHRFRVRAPRRAHPERFQKATRRWSTDCRTVRRIVSFIPWLGGWSSPPCTTATRGCPFMNNSRMRSRSGGNACTA